MSDLKSTPLYEEHLRLGGKMVPFAGWNMPVQFEGLKQEHALVRNQVGIFDVSHMGEIHVQGPKALETLEWVCSNNVGRLDSGKAIYTLLPNEKGGLVDDVIVYCLNKPDDYFICVNAANKDKDWAWISKHNKGAKLTDESDQWAQIAIQGPNAMTLVGRLFGSKAQSLPFFQFTEATYDGAGGYVTHTGYTGEEGVEVFLPKDKAVALWKELLEKGKDLGVGPVGLGARDTLRTEMKYSLYGHEITDETNPYAAGLGWAVKPGKKDFIGKDVIVAQKEQGLSHGLVGFKLNDRGIPRQGYKLFSLDDKEVGWVTSGTVSPTLGESIGIAYITSELLDIGAEFLVEIRNRKVKARVVETPFVKPKGE